MHPFPVLALRTDEHGRMKCPTLDGVAMRNITSIVIEADATSQVATVEIKMLALLDVEIAVDPARLTKIEEEI